MMHIITGDGKGKTSAAAGMALRMSAYGKSVLFAQLLKGSGSGEALAFGNIPNVTVKRLSRDYGFVWSMSDEDKAAVVREHNEILRTALDGDFNMIILDEAIPAMNMGLLDTELLFGVLEKNCEIVLTGREPKAEILKKADYISEIKKVRHPFDKGDAAREGIEY